MTRFSVVPSKAWWRGFERVLPWWYLPIWFVEVGYLIYLLVRHR